MTNELTKEQVQEGMANKTLKFCGFISEQDIPKLKKGLFYWKTKQGDLVAEAFDIPKEDVYVYKKLK